MPKQFWVNLPVRDITKAGEFYEKIGFTVKIQNKQQAQLIIGESAIMLFEETAFKTLARHEIADSKQATEVLFSISVESRDEVDNIAEMEVQLVVHFLVSQQKNKDGYTVVDSRM